MNLRTNKYSSLTLKISRISFEVLLVFSFFTFSSAKQKIILHLKQPLRAENTVLRLGEITARTGATHDLEKVIILSSEELPKEIEAIESKFDLALNVKPLNKGYVIDLTLPKSGNVVLQLMDFYGKNLATILEGNFERGSHSVMLDQDKMGDPNGIQFIALKLDGKIVLRKVLTKVH